MVVVVVVVVCLVSSHGSLGLAELSFVVSLVCDVAGRCVELHVALCIQTCGGCGPSYAAFC